ncbi:MAG: general secretion pathway protein GspB [Xanthomonadales bacterium]|nr:general secretion pathway protein GspB [Xanthomonadales bacterium]
MSLILDALKRSEAERQAGSAESPAALAPRPSASNRLLPGLLVLVVLGAAALWLWQQRAGSPAQPVAPPDDSSILAPQQTTAAESEPETRTEPVPSPANRPADDSDEVPADDPTPAREPREAPQQVASEQPEEPVLVDLDPPATEPAPATVAPPPDYLPVEALPAGAARDFLRSMTVNMHVFAPEAENRFVLINLQRKEQGDELEAGVVLAEITAQGMVVEVDGRRYLWQSR